jgi:hypothetical protein
MDNIPRLGGLMKFFTFLLGVLLLLYLFYEGIIGNIANTEPGAVAGAVYWFAGIFHYNVTANLVLLFYIIALMVGLALVLIGLGGKSES